MADDQTKVEVIVHQFIASWDNEETLDDVIALWTEPFNRGTPPHSHSEIELLRAPLCPELYRRNPTFCFSATLRGIAEGTRFAYPSQVLKHLANWDSYGKQITAKESDIMLTRAVEISGRPYFKIGIVLDFALPFGILGGWLGKILDQWYCSMAVYYVITSKRKRISPRRLTKWLLKNGWTYIPKRYPRFKPATKPIEETKNEGLCSKRILLRKWMRGV